MYIKISTPWRIVLAFFIVLSVAYFWMNDWHLKPRLFVTYAGSDSANISRMDTSKVSKHYSKYCAGCHGRQMEKFVKHDWKFGKTKAAIFKAIKYGYTTTGMPAFDKTFSDKETYELTSYLLSGIEKYKQKPPVVGTSTGQYSTDLLKIRIDTVAKIAEVPWSIAFLPGNELLVTERSGKLYRVNAGALQQVQGLPALLAAGQGGLMEVVLHPLFQTNQIIYLSYSKPGADGTSTTAILKARLQGNQLTDQQDIFVAKPYSNTRHHYGGKMLFGRDGYLYFSVGERGNEKQNPQSLANDLGKIHRIKDDGGIPADNPFVGNNSVSPSIYSYGHRNPQGIAVNPATGAVWSTEHGPMGGDEINIIQKGKNYGWPVITYGINYNGTSITDKTAAPGMEQPVHFWVPSIATSGLAFVQGNVYNGWQGDALIGSLKFNWLSRCKLAGNVVSAEETMLKEVGRLRDVRVSPDGYIYLAVESPGYILRLMPG
ncbi:MAG: hypothetical protein RL172_2355 [Bacteroidota bacterium]